MIKQIFLLLALAVAALLVAACGETSKPGVASIGAQANPASGETPAPTIGSVTIETTTTASTPAASTAEADATGGRSGSSRVETPVPTIAPTPRDTAPVVTATPAVVESTGPVAGGGLTQDAEALFDLASQSPAALFCIAGQVGFQTMRELSSRVPTDQEMTRLLACLDGGEDTYSATTSISSQWQERIDAALMPTSCAVGPQGGYPSSYYGGPLIDSHLHIPNLPDDGFGGFDLPDDSTQSRGVDSALYDAIAEEDQPLLGRTVNIGDIVCSLQAEGTIRAFAFFPVFQDIAVQMVEVARRTMEEYPTLFVPFIQTPGREASTVEADIFERYLEISPGLFFGHGEVGDSPTEPINPPPDSVLYTEIFEVDTANNLSVYFHTGVGHQEHMARALQSFPDITFIVHGDFVRPHIDDLIDRYPNIYFTFNDIFDDLIPRFRFGNKEDFVSAFERDWDSMLNQAFDMYKSMIEAHPDRYMWGTDRSDIAWNYDTAVGKLLSDFGRAFIGKFDPDIQEKIAYKNAERLIANSNNP